MNLLHNQFLQIYVLFLYTYGKINESEKTVVFNETHLQKIFFENLRTTKLCEKKERTSEQCHEFEKK